MTILRSSAGGDKPAATLKAEIQAAAAQGYRFYVYTLSDAHGVFYVGKGQRNRLFQHEKMPSTEQNWKKLTRLALGVPDKAILAFFRDECDAYGYESELIAAGADVLTNMQPGQHNRREVAISHARAMLARLRSLESWRASISARNLRWVQEAFGSIDALYEKTVATLQQKIAAPQSTAMIVRDDGTWEWVW
jgi:hypothetical protein